MSLTSLSLMLQTDRDERGLSLLMTLRTTPEVA
jgi:hypothetical protein